MMKSWKTLLVGVVLAAIGVLQAAKADSLKDAVNDFHVQLAILAAISAVLSKDFNQK